MKQRITFSARSRLALLAIFACGSAISQSAEAQEAPPAPAPAEPTPVPADGANTIPANPQPAPGPPPGTEAPVVASPYASATGAKSADDAAAEAAAEAAAAEALASADISAAAADDYKINFYGFADFAYSAQLTTSRLVGARPTFAVGNFNLYMGADLGDNWRTLTEVRFMYLPHGTIPSSALYAPNPPPRTDTNVPDYTDIDRPVRWGGLSIQRAQVERQFFAWLTVRAGQFLTPYGIWNVDHGSPVIIGVHRPYIVGEALFPSQQTGLEFLGSTIAGPVEVGYHLTLSNGRGPVDSYMDLDGNKALGARIYARHRSDFGTLTVGFSGYRGKYSDRTTVTSFDAQGGVILKQPLTIQYDELSLAADLKLEAGGFLLQSEAIMNEVAYKDKVRPPLLVLSGPPGLTPDNRRSGIYAFAGYRFPFLGIMPFVGGDYYYLGEHTLNPDVAAFHGGLNLRPTARIVLKAEYVHVWFPNAPSFGPALPSLNRLDLQIAWSF